MIRNLFIFSLLAIMAFGMATSSIDVLCLLLWHVEPQAGLLESHDHMPAHHPDAHESHVAGGDHQPPLTVLVLSSIVDDALSATSLFDYNNSSSRSVVLSSNIILSQLQKEPIERPPQILS